MISKRIAFSALLYAILITAFGTSHRLFAQFDLGGPGGLGGPVGADHVTWKLRIEPEKLAPGAEGEIVAEYTLEAGWTMYAPSTPKGDIPVIKTEIKITHPQIEALGDAAYPKPKVSHDADLDQTFHKLDGTGAFRQKFRLKPGAAAGPLELEPLLTYQACDDSTCDPLTKDKPFPVTLTVAGGEKPTSPKTGGVGDLLGAPGIGAPGIGAPGGGAFGDDDPVMKFTIVPPSGELVRGEKVTLTVKYTIAEGWYSYAPDHDVKNGAPGSPVTPSAPEGAPYKIVGKARAPSAYDKSVKILPDEPAKNARAIKGSGEIRQDITLLADATPGSIATSLVVNWAACEDKEFGTCTIPTDETLTFAANVSSAAAVDSAVKGSAAKPDSPAPSIDDEEITEESKGFGAAFGGLWGLILAMVGGGLFALVMPCTYPMIPLTIAFFTKQAEKRGGKVLPLALLYGAGIIVSFVVIGLVIGEPIIRFAQSFSLNLIFGIIFVLFALSFFDVFQIRLPGSVMNVANRASGSSGYLGVFVLGLTLVITSFTCTAPVMGTMLASIGTAGGSRLEVMFGMAIFGLTLATPFVFLALFPAKVRSLPSSGEWMHTVKIFLGFLELAAAFKFFSNADLALFSGDFVISRQLFLLIWSTIFLLMALYLLNFIRLKSEDTKKISGGRMLAGLAVLFGSIYFYEGSRGMPLDPLTLALAPPATKGEWPLVKDDFEGAMELAKNERKRVLINFTGFT